MCTTKCVCHILYRESSYSKRYIFWLKTWVAGFKYDSLNNVEVMRGTDMQNLLLRISWLVGICLGQERWYRPSGCQFWRGSMKIGVISIRSFAYYKHRYVCGACERRKVLNIGTNSKLEIKREASDLGC